VPAADRFVFLVAKYCAEWLTAAEPMGSYCAACGHLSDLNPCIQRLALHCVYFATAKPTRENPDVGLLASQERTLRVLASDFQTYLQSKLDARWTLEGHADRRGSVEYNQALSERRVERIKHFLVELGVPAANIQTKAFDKQQDLTDAQVRDAVERNPELSAEDRRGGCSTT
jgi:hypothetical protein